MVRSANSKWILWIILCVIFVISFRIPTTPGPVNPDSYRTLEAAGVYIEKQNIVNTNGLESMVGRYPMSYPPALSILVGILWLITGIDVPCNADVWAAHNKRQNDALSLHRQMCFSVSTND